MPGVAIHDRTIAANSSIVMPVCVTVISSTMPFSPDEASVFMSPARTDLYGSVVFHSG
jgi:hypothetical protein